MQSLLHAWNDIQRRADLLPQEVSDWHASASANVNDMGIHRSQFNALKIMMDELHAKQRALLDQLAPDLPVGEFANKYLELTDDIVGTHDLWRIFRYIMAQHEDARFKRLVIAADLIAADCYLMCMNRLRGWGLIQEQQFREPPLVYLEAEASPSTASRGNAVESLGFPLRRYRNMRLPIPIVLLPFDHATSIWMFCNLHHEVGHNLDQDLKLGGEITNHLMTRMDKENIPPERQQMWWKWCGEIIADTFGVLLGGAGFANALSGWLLTLAPADRFQQLNTQDVHPPFYVRISLIAEMLRGCGVQSLAQAADAITVAWNNHHKPDWVAQYLADTNAIVDVFLNQPLTALGGQHSLLDFNPKLEQDAALARQVADCLPNYSNCPDPAIIYFNHRLVPVAAQLAVTDLDDPTVQKLDAVQTNALKYLERLFKPQFLAGAGRQEFLRDLTRQIEFK